MNTSTDVPTDQKIVKFLVIGGGYSGKRLVAELQRQGVEVLLTSRQKSGEASQLVFNSETDDLPSLNQLTGITHLVSTVPPDANGSDPCLRCLGSILATLPLRWVGYLSSTGVYGNTSGGWVDEQSAPALPLQDRSAARLACEEAWQAQGFPLQIFRLPGIYGPNRNPLGPLSRGLGKLVHKPGQVFGRIHVDDIVGALLHCLSLPKVQQPNLINVVDHLPAPSSNTWGYAAHLLGCQLPNFQSFASIEAELSPMAKSFWQENRRVSNQLLTKQLGYKLKYPTYREGLQACFKEEGFCRQG
jgi:nucleoside-diphosphate-sugar epimerase